jgi:tetratricopeptide (TPR) repeat protein
VALAEYYIRLANFDKARDIFEEGIHTVLSVRDFSQIWDAYTQFEDNMIDADMQTGGEGDDDEADFDLRLARYENLINQRPLLVSSVVLRQNPHNVNEWHKRVKLYPEDPVQAAKVFAEAVKTVDPKQATGKPHTLWVAYAKLYERHGDLSTARMIFKKATQVAHHRHRLLPSLNTWLIGWMDGLVTARRSRSKRWTILRRCGASGPRWSCERSTTTRPSRFCSRPAPSPESSNLARFVPPTICLFP